MKISRAIVTLMVAVMLVFAVPGFSGETLGDWSDWTKTHEKVSYRVRCSGYDNFTGRHIWDVEVENKTGLAGKFGVTVTQANEIAVPGKGWLTWPVFNGNRHIFSGYRCAAAPGENIQVWLRNFTPAITGTKPLKTSSPAGKDTRVGQVFISCGKEWLVGAADLDWTQTQEWIKGLGQGWRSPTTAELVELFQERGQNSPIGQDFIWAEPRDAHSAWHFSFYYREVRWGYFDDHSKYGRALATRAQ